MSKVLVKFEKDWADEFDVVGFAVYDKEQWERDLNEFKLCKVFGGCWFGTNEGWEGDEILEDKEGWVSSWEVTDITDTDCEALARLFGHPFHPGSTDAICFGTFKGPRELTQK